MSDSIDETLYFLVLEFHHCVFISVFLPLPPPQQPKNQQPTSYHQKVKSCVKSRAKAAMVPKIYLHKFKVLEVSFILRKWFFKIFKHEKI